LVVVLISMWGFASYWWNHITWPLRPPAAGGSLDVAPCGFIPYIVVHQWSIVLLGTAPAWSRHTALDTATMPNLSLVNRYSFTDIQVDCIPYPICSLLYSLFIQLHISALHQFIIHFIFGRIMSHPFPKARAGCIAYVCQDLFPHMFPKARAGCIAYVCQDLFPHIYWCQKCNISKGQCIKA
jgi:hypothetical protein